MTSVLNHHELVQKLFMHLTQFSMCKLIIYAANMSASVSLMTHKGYAYIEILVCAPALS